MHYVFKSKATADLILMQPHAEQLLKILGIAPAAKGILPAASLPGAIAAVEAAVAEARRRPQRPQGDEARADEEDDEDDGADLARRAWPFVDMLKRASAGGADVVWGV